MFAIFACTWTIHHPNVPRQYHGYRRDFKLQSDNEESNPHPCSHSDTSWNWRLRSFLKSTGRMILTIFAPEVIIAVAYNERLAARADHESLVKQAREDEIEWSWIHTYYANMGGFVIEKKGYELWVNGEYNMHHLSGRDILVLRKMGYIKKLPDMPKRELKDRAKSDSLIKAISIIQIIWSTVRILDRAITGLPICALELTVLAFALCAVVIYWLYWDKPKSIGVATIIDRCKSYEEIQKALEKARDGDVDTSKTLTKENGSTKTESNASINTGGDGNGVCKKGMTVNERTVQTESLKTYNTKHIFSLKRTQASSQKSAADHQESKPVDEDGAPMRIDTIRQGKEFDNGTFWALLVGVVLFGGIHIGGWRIEFPSYTHQMLWRVATIYSVGCVFIALAAVLLRKIGENCSDSFLLGTLPRCCGKFLHIAGLFLYVIARLVILFEMFWTLLFLPPNTFVSGL